jgi:hypothetical protein
MTFDPSTFMQQNVDAPMAETFRQVPENEYPAIIDDFEAEKAFSEVNWQDKKTGEPKSAVQWSIPFVIQDGALASELDREKIVVYAKGFLDLDDNGGISTAPDRNVRLGQIRAAVGQQSGAWNFGMLKGAGPVMIRVTHRSNPKNPEQKFVEVSRVSPIR